MKTIRLITVLTLLAGISIVPATAATASARLFCWSLRMSQGNGPFDATLDLSTLAGANNGELAPQFSFYSHYSDIVLYDGLFTSTGIMDLDVPINDDADNDGFPDFFQVAQGVASTVTAGEFDTGFSGGVITATWSRAPGSKDGTCVLNLEDDIFGDLGDYVHTFEILEYKGPLIYTPGNSIVNSSLVLTQTAATANTLLGPATFVKVATNRFNQLGLQAGGWTNASAQALTFFPQMFFRDSLRPTNYYGAIVFDDGHLDTAGEDYWYWWLSIDDPNDTDHDTIPDFSDDLLPSVRQPKLTLSLGSGNLQLTISDTVGKTNQIQQTISLPTGWQTIMTLVQTNDPQTVTLPLPSGPRFWQATRPQ